MDQRGSRTKGDRYERRIARIIGDWWGRPVYRTPRSGGTHWKGDLICTEEALPFSVECKKRESWSFRDLFSGHVGKDNLWGFWSQCLDAAEEDRRIPLLVFSKNRQMDYAMVAVRTFSKLWDLFGKDGGMIKCVTAQDSVRKGKYVYVVPLVDLLAWMDVGMFDDIAVEGEVWC